MFGAYALTARCEDHCPFDLILELADVARPIVLLKQIQGGTIKFTDLLLLALACDRQEASRQQWYVAPPRAQRWKLDRESSEAVVEVGAKPARRDRGLEIEVGRREYSHVYLLGPRIPDRDDLSVLKHAQQRRLHRERHLAYLVEKNDPAGSGAEETGLIAVGAGVGAATMTKQLALKQVLRQRGAVDREERLVGPRAHSMDRTRDVLLAGASLTHKQHRDRGDRGAVHEMVDFGHLGTDADDF